MSVIQVNNLTKRYGDFTAVDHVSFQVEKGSMLGFLGVNGAGKTTVINMLATLLAPDEGSAKVCGEVLGNGNQEIRKKIGIVYQQNCLDELLSVQENLMCRGIIHGTSKRDAVKQCEKLSSILKLEDILKKKYKMLSGGQKRRCEIAAALMHTPEILFLDEPTTGLDPATRLDVWSTIEKLQRTEKMTVFLTTHYMEEAAKADNIIIMDKGHIITAGTPFELKERFAKDKVKLFYRNGKVESVTVASTLEALPMLQACKEELAGFEVIQGNMDDVFLNAVGRELNGEGEK
ncbi:MAG: ABC transporter ATP-binding protein [Lachnospiraceae bacterium]|nr:ABC transporter ATP-binding protein [Lachnospiraceae bacterium]